MKEGRLGRCWRVRQGTGQGKSQCTGCGRESGRRPRLGRKAERAEEGTGQGPGRGLLRGQGAASGGERSRGGVGEAGPGRAVSHRCAASTRKASCPSCRACGRTPRGTGSTGGPPSPRRGSALLLGPGIAPGRCTPAPRASAGSAPRRAPPPCRCRPKPWGPEGRRRRTLRCRRPRGEQEPSSAQKGREEGEAERPALTNGGERLSQAAGSAARSLLASFTTLPPRCIRCSSSP